MDLDEYSDQYSMENQNDQFTTEDYEYIAEVTTKSDVNSNSNQLHFERPEACVVPIILALTFVIGLIGNAAIIIMFIRNKFFRNVSYTYIFSVALADLLVILACIPFKFLMFNLDSWPWGTTVCQITEATMNISVVVSVFSLTALSISSYFSIAKKSQNTRTRIATILTVTTTISIWIFAILLAIPAYIGSHVRTIVVSSTIQISYCNPYPDEWGHGYPRMVAVVKLLVHYCAPLAIIGLFYLLIEYRLVQRNKNVSKEMQYGPIPLQVKTQVAYTILILVLIFGVCFLPAHVFFMWFTYSPTALEDYNEWWHSLRIVAFCLSFVKSCINPIVLYCRDETFRIYFKRYLLCRKSSTYHLEEPMSLSTRAAEPNNYI